MVSPSNAIAGAANQTLESGAFAASRLITTSRAPPNATATTSASKAYVRGHVRLMRGTYSARSRSASYLGRRRDRRQVGERSTPRDDDSEPGGSYRRAQEYSTRKEHRHVTHHAPQSRGADGTLERRSL